MHKFRLSAILIGRRVISSIFSVGIIGCIIVTPAYACSGGYAFQIGGGVSLFSALMAMGVCAQEFCRGDTRKWKRIRQFSLLSFLCIVIGVAMLTMLCG